MCIRSSYDKKRSTTYNATRQMIGMKFADFYDEYSFIPIQKTDDIEFYPYAVDKEGNFIIE